MNKKKELPGFWPDDFAYREFFEYLSRTPPLYINKIVCIMTRVIHVGHKLIPTRCQVALDSIACQTLLGSRGSDRK